MYKEQNKTNKIDILSVDLLLTGLWFYLEILGGPNISLDTENPKQFIISEFTKVAEYKTDIKNSIIFLYS